MQIFGGGLVLSLLISVLLCVHVVRTNQQIYWIFIILLLGPLGCLVYVVAVIVPEMAGGTRAKRMGMAARDALDPSREYRTAKAAAADTPTVHNQMRLAAAAAAMGRHAEAEQLYAGAATGIHADDPALLLGRANALIELGRAPEAAPLIDKLVEEQPTRSPATASRKPASTRRSATTRRPTPPTSGPPAGYRAWKRWPATPRSWPTPAASRKPPTTSPRSTAASSAPTRSSAAKAALGAIWRRRRWRALDLTGRPHDFARLA